MGIEISERILDEMLRHAKMAYPRESCGVLVGSSSGDMARANYFTVCENIHADNPSRRFLIDPLAYLEIEDRADAEGLSIVSIVHSHPDHPDEPSAFDRQHAWPGLSYIIISVSGGRIAGYSSWRLTGDRGGFVAEPILPGGSYGAPD